MEMEKTPVVNPGKNELIQVDGVQYRRLCIKTHVIKDGDSIPEAASWLWVAVVPLSRRQPLSWSFCI